MVHLVRWFASGVVIGLILASAPSCQATEEECEASCSGCCDASGNCNQGSSTAACGSGGSTCVACGATESCISGLCIGGNPQTDGGGSDAGGCGPANCGGCCNAAGVCLNAGGNAACGLNGAPCDACDVDAGEKCGSTGVCEGCGPNTCTGCCSASGACLTGAAIDNCGWGGLACTPCNGMQTCLPSDGGGSCVAYGAACTSDADCASIGQGAVCLQETSPGGSVYPGGYCTKPCTKAADCGTFVSCLNSQAGRLFGEESSLCLARCIGPGNCRTGYTCYSSDGGLSGCWLSPPPTPGLIGTACTLNSTCQRAGTQPGGMCQFTSVGGNPTGYVNGYCTADCTGNPQFCPAGSICLTVKEGERCMDLCNEPDVGKGDCRPGYVCERYDAGGTPSTDGICRPDCHNTGAECATGLSCTSLGYCQ